jgi:glycerol-3-phosphate dehydrogenase
MEILILGAGNFGTCLAQHLSSNSHTVSIWDRDTPIIESINKSHRNPYYLSDVKLATTIRGIARFEAKDLAKFEVIVLAVPAQALRSVMNLIKPGLGRTHLLVCAAKGIEISTLKIPTQLAEELLGKEIAEAMVTLSGPSFASEVVQGQPTGVSVASKNKKAALLCQRVFHSPKFRVYTSDDPVGLEIAGALKNVIAIATGACAGLGFQANARATLITRGLAEITRIGLAMGATPQTFTGLGGVGDLFLTCSSEKSRNFTVGFEIGQGTPLTAALANLGSTAEGVTTAKSGYHLAQHLKIYCPITTLVYQVLYEGKDVRAATVELMTGSPKAENEF